MTYQLVSVDNPTAPPLPISPRLRSQLVYFMTPPDAPHVPPLIIELSEEQEVFLEWLTTHHIQHIRVQGVP